MGSQPAFFEKNFLDHDNAAATITASQAPDFATYARHRSLKYAWITTGSVDADNTYIECDLGGDFNIDRMILADHNFKSYKVEVYDFITELWTIIYQTADDEDDTSELVLNEFYGRRFRLTILGTQVADSDKRLGRWIITKKLGQFQYWPKITDFELDEGKDSRLAGSRKASIIRRTGAVKFRLTFELLKNIADVQLIEKLYRQVQGFEVWPSGGDDAQFFFAPEGYRKKDIFVMGIRNTKELNFDKGIYVNPLRDVRLDFIEVVR